MDVFDIFSWSSTCDKLLELRKLLACSVCKDLAVDPVLLKSCQHVVCSSCLSASDDTGCPECGTEILPSGKSSDRITAELGCVVKHLCCVLPVQGGTPVTDSESARKICYGKQSSVSSKKDASKFAKKLMDTTLLVNSTENNLTLNSASKKVALQTPDSKSKKRHSFPLSPFCADRLCLTPKLEKKNIKGETTLQVACVKGDSTCVEQLLKDGANPNTRDHAGWTPLHEACNHGHMEIAKMLLEAGALIDVPSYQGNTTPLHDAVDNGRCKIVELLRQFGARDDLRDVQGRTARQLAITSAVSEQLLRALNTVPSPSAASRRPAPLPARTPVLLFSNISPTHQQMLVEFVKKHRIKCVREYSAEVTHVIVGCETERPVCLRTAKYLLAVLAGLWVLSHRWLEECVAADAMVDPEPYEVTGTSQNVSSGAPTRSRLNALSMRPGLLCGCHVFLYGKFAGDSVPSKQDLECLVRAGDGKLLAREPDPERVPLQERTVPYHALPDSPMSHCSHIILYQEGSDSEPQLKYDMPHLKTLPLTWLIDCIDHFQLLPPFTS